MSLFRDADELYEFLGGLFVSLDGDAEFGPKMRKANTIVQYAYTDPDATITMKLIADELGQVDLGPTDLEPEIVMTMTADVGHRFWLGEVNITVALARGQMRATGPVAKVLKMVPLAKPVFPRYRAWLEDRGRADLTEMHSGPTGHPARSAR